MDLNKFVGNKLRNYRLNQGYTLSQIAHKMQTTPQTISRWEKGERNLTQNHLFEFSKIYNVSIDTFFPPKEKILDDELKKLNNDDIIKLKEIINKIND